MSTLETITDEIKKTTVEFDTALKEVTTPQELEQLRIKFLGKKGSITALTKHIGAAPVEEKKIIGKEINILKSKAVSTISEKDNSLKDEIYRKSLSSERIDVSLPGRIHPRGTIHPLTHITEQICSSFNKMGFLTIEGPEIEKEYYNFEALNIPANHPARDSQDSFYLIDDYLLRTQTSPMQIRIMENNEPPIAVIAPGRVYRRDTIDASHSPIFHQIEGLFVAKDVTLADLKGVLHNFCAEMFGKDVKIRFRPDYFPFTEPSCEISISCVMCDGKGCSTCGGDGWLEILGAGMVNPLVLENVNIDPKIYSGFAFGIGIERMAMLKYGISDIRAFYENNHQFLQQFKIPS